MKTIYQEIPYYSIFHDCEVVRVSISGPQNLEYFSIVPKPSKNWPALREEVLQKLESTAELQARANSLSPGEIPFP